MKLLICIPLEFTSYKTQVFCKAIFDYKGKPYGMEGNHSGTDHYLSDDFAESWQEFLERKFSNSENANFVRWREENATRLNACT